MKREIQPNGDLVLHLDPMDGWSPTECDEAELFEAYGLDRVWSEDIGALTDSPIVCEYGDDSTNPEGPVWWFPDYAVYDWREELARNGRVTFRRASED